jgi:hypothetical protein
MLLTESHAVDISGTISTYDRVIINGTAGTWGYSGGMTAFFNAQGYRIFDFAKVFIPTTESIKANAELLAQENGLEIEYIRKLKAFRKDDKIAEIILKRGEHPGLVHIFSALELNSTYSPWHDKTSGKTFFKNDQTKCLTYYFYFIDKELGLCFLRVPTIAPFKVMFYFNGHNWIETKFKENGLEYTKQDNAFVDISDFAKAQDIANSIRIPDLHKILDFIVKRYLPLPEDWKMSFNWTIHQVEYALDICFKNEMSLKPLYDSIIKTAMHTVTPDNIANFLGKRFSVLFEGEAGSKYNQRILGTRIKHQMGEVSIKIYDKFGKVLRIEVTCNDVSKLKIFREIQHRDGSTTTETAPVKKSIYSLFPLITVFKNACNRYLEFISSFDDPTDGLKKLDKVVEDKVEHNRNYKGFNFFNKKDEQILKAVADGKFNISGLTNKGIRGILPQFNSSQVSRILKRLHVHGLIKKVGNAYKYYLTSIGKQVVTAGLSFKNTSLIPALSV